MSNKEQSKFEEKVIDLFINNDDEKNDLLYRAIIMTLVSYKESKIDEITLKIKKDGIKIGGVINEQQSN